MSQERPKQPLLSQAQQDQLGYDVSGLGYNPDTSETIATGGAHASLSEQSNDVGISVLESHDGLNPSHSNQKRKKTGAYLSFENIQLSIPVSNNEQETTDGNGEKFILDGVSGEAFPGQLLGIIGASGGGKTTLLSMISGRLYRIESLASKSTASGEIFLNKTRIDCSRSSDFEYLRESMGFVLQEDLLFETETAGEAVEVSAQLRLNNAVNGRYLTTDEKIERAGQILKELDLWKSRNTKIGGTTVRGLSGGERKRVSIGVELVTDPNILLLDEPTSGLDSAIAFQTMQLLKNLAKQGKTVVCSLHQPSSEIFSLIDKVLILAKGKVVYNGFVTDLASYLKDYTGYECPQYSNVADFVLQQVHEQPDYFISKWDEYMSKSNETSFIPPSADSQLQKQLSVSKAYRKSSSDFTHTIERKQMAPICTQISILLKRQFKIFVRNPLPTYVRNGQALFTALLEGILWWQLPDIKESDSSTKIQTNIYNRFGGIFYAIAFAAMNAVMAANLTFPSQRTVFQKERSSNWYYTIPFIFGKTLIDLPLAWLTMLPFAIIVYYMCNFNSEWYEIYLVLALVATVADSMGFFIGCVAKRPEIAIQLTPLTVIPLFLFSGFFISINSIPSWIRWIKWIDCFYYGTEIFCINEFQGQGSEAETFLESKGLNPDNKMRDIYALIIVAAAFRLFAFIFLIRRNGW